MSPSADEKKVLAEKIRMKLSEKKNTTANNHPDDEVSEEIAEEL